MNVQLLRTYISLLTEAIRTKKGLKGKYGGQFGDKFDLKKFKSITDPQEMTKYCAAFLDVLGHGSSRIVFTLSGRHALKIAWNAKGIAQNEAEVDTFTNPKSKNVVAKIYSSADDFRWVIADLVKQFKDEKEFESLTGVMFDTFTNQISQALEGETKGKAPMVMAAAETVKQNKLIMGDVMKIDSWGKTPDGRPVLLDYGFTRGVADKHYPKQQKSAKPEEKTSPYDTEKEPDKVEPQPRDLQKTGR